ncbi:hypothetical protein [Nocardia harenae]|uniref:hypothetical protein n=1 Tax=Nocardia harenae TaxID=358707 RepID=UPI00082D063B|nr:hypothetical protein [Nocardia harenae]
MTYDYRARIVDDQEQLNRATIYGVTARTDTGFTGEYDPPTVPRSSAALANAAKFASKTGRGGCAG